MEYTVARARYPLGPRWGITVMPQVGRPRPAVMPEVGPPEVPVMARGGADVSVTSYNKLQQVTTSYNSLLALVVMYTHSAWFIT